LGAIDTLTKIEDPTIETIKLNLKNLERELGKKEFEKLITEVTPKVDEIMNKIIDDMVKARGNVP
jgi:hypothetical protein